ncbi:MAG: hypothetical protein ACK559_24695, partial [bacterium]
LRHHVERRRPRRVGPPNDPCSFQRAELSLGDFQLVWIQAASFGKNRAARCLHKMANAMPRPRRTFAIADETGERRQEGADRWNTV